MDALNYINTEISKIESDTRFNDKPALIEINAPLALIQVDLKARHRALNDVLENIKPK